MLTANLISEEQLNDKKCMNHLFFSLNYMCLDLSYSPTSQLYNNFEYFQNVTLYIKGLFIYLIVSIIPQRTQSGIT